MSLLLLIFLPELKSLQCNHCLNFLGNDTNVMIEHSKYCEGVLRPDKSYKFICCVCDYHSYYNQNMVRHFRKHTGEKPFKCPLCEYKSNDPSNLKFHMRIKH